MTKFKIARAPPLGSVKDRAYISVIKYNQYIINKCSELHSDLTLMIKSKTRWVT